MAEFVKPMAEYAASMVEAIGVLVIVGGSIYSLGFAAVHAYVSGTSESTLQAVRQRLGRGILLGLEFLVAGDIIHTVAVELTFQTVGVLAIIVLIRTFLSFTLELELTGSWPWQKHADTDAGPAVPDA